MFIVLKHWILVMTWPIWGQWLFDHLNDYCLRHSTDSGRKNKSSEYLRDYIVQLIYSPIYLYLYMLYIYLYIYICYIYMHVYFIHWYVIYVYIFSSHFELHFCHISPVVGTLRGTLLVFTSSVFITPSGSYWYYSNPISFTKWWLWVKGRLSNDYVYTANR